MYPGMSGNSISSLTLICDMAKYDIAIKNKTSANLLYKRYSVIINLVLDFYCVLDILSAYYTLFALLLIIHLRYHLRQAYGGQGKLRWTKSWVLVPVITHLYSFSSPSLPSSLRLCVSASLRFILYFCLNTSHYYIYYSFMNYDYFLRFFSVKPPVCSFVIQNSFFYFLFFQ